MKYEYLHSTNVHLNMMREMILGYVGNIKALEIEFFHNKIIVQKKNVF